MINIKPIKASSETHNYRKREYKHVEKDLKKLNEHWENMSVHEMTKKVQKYCKDTSKRKMQKNAQPIREGVILINPEHTMADLKRLAKRLEEEFKIECFQIHIHKDEGHHEKIGKDKNEKGDWKPNLHAHMVFRWQDMETGKVKRLWSADLSRMQSVVAETLKMERGELKTQSNRERLEPVAFKVQKEELHLKELEQKKIESDKELMSLLEREESEKERISLAKAKEVQIKSLETSSMNLKRNTHLIQKDSLNQAKMTLIGQLVLLKRKLMNLKERLTRNPSPKAIERGTNRDNKNRGI